MTLASFPSPPWPQSFHGFHRSKGCQDVGLRVGVLIFQHLPNFDLTGPPDTGDLFDCAAWRRCWTALGSFGLSSAQRCCGTSHGYPCGHVGPMSSFCGTGFHITPQPSPAWTFSTSGNGGIGINGSGVTKLRWRPHWESSSTWRMVRNCTC